MWFVGSSSNNKAGSLSKARAKATRICQPPDNSEQGRSVASAEKPRPASTARARSRSVWPSSLVNAFIARSCAAVARATLSESPSAASNSKRAASKAMPAKRAGISATASS
mmetsp:Transcript_104310/g.319345  ORF Transcript_104310/g.319345 Transcript_104310/m.319345 type:complete len:111 (-) Transcript_104310:60-392(-)